MVIETKLSLGDKVYLIYNNKVVEAEVDRIECIIRKELDSEILYTLEVYEENCYSYPEIEETLFGVRVFKTKEELIASL